MMRYESRFCQDRKGHVMSAVSDFQGKIKQEVHSDISILFADRLYFMTLSYINAFVLQKYK